MRILEAFGEPISYGGQESFVINVIDNMDRTGLEIDLLSPYYCDNVDIVGKIRHYGGEVYALGCDFRPGRNRNNTVEPIRRFLATHTYDVIHIHSGSNSMLAIFARLAAEDGIHRIIVHSHCTGKTGLKHSMSKSATEKSLRKYPTVYCACSREAGEWRFPEDICRNELIIINNGIDVERFRYDESVRTRMRSALGLSDDTVLIGCVGRLTYQKNQEFLLEVMEAVRKKTAADDSGAAADYRLILIGDGEDRKHLEVRAKDMGLKDSVIFTGTVDNVQDYLQAMDVAALPSRYEGLSISAIEAQAAGLEILASDAIPESASVTGGVSFLPADERGKWAEAILESHSRHPEQADQVAENGYSILDTADVVRNLYVPHPVQ